MDRHSENAPNISSSSGMTRREVRFSGRVQGVGFRYTTISIAGDFDVTGHVCNLSNGQVEMVIEGTPRELDRFVREVKARMSGYIDSVDVSEHPATGQFGRFGLKY